MKKSIIFYLLFFMALSFTTNAQQLLGSVPSNKKEIRLAVFGSYAFEDSFDSYYDFGNYYQGQLQGGFLWGAGIEFEARHNSFIELSYQRMNTNAPTQYYNGGLFDKFNDFDVAMNYILIGATQSFRNQYSPVEGFFGGMLGMGIINIKNPNNTNSDNTTKFAWGVKGGMIYWASPKVGIKFQAQLLSITQSVGGGVYFGTGGLSTGVSSYSSLYQFSLGGGLVFNLSN